MTFLDVNNICNIWKSETLYRTMLDTNFFSREKCQIGSRSNKRTNRVLTNDRKKSDSTIFVFRLTLEHSSEVWNVWSPSLFFFRVLPEGKSKSSVKQSDKLQLSKSSSIGCASSRLILETWHYPFSDLVTHFKVIQLKFSVHSLCLK